MAGEGRQQLAFRTAPVTLGNELLRTRQQPLCGDPEGWGPMSSLRYDFTPCFLDVWVLFVAAWGVFAGAGAIWYLLKRRTAQPVPKNWHFYAKLVVLRIISAANTSLTMG